MAITYPNSLLSLRVSDMSQRGAGPDGAGLYARLAESDGEFRARAAGDETVYTRTIETVDNDQVSDLLLADL
jgi:hypothetical protein